ncbi:helix-turn-helix transcriptional regulator [Acaryochloris sp. 'Moss Beach']|uniref:helix-turn-helix domain-containing protein n=1 Tax=Acaryochloris TaxID=155977 RepID=UPI001BAFCB47|nr:MULTISPECIES: helix-turn-helix transcriptional regulator [Acaryochloris]QUY40726.1 helix-turn-helix transcriptional regulator [Acaryochloris marina S15]UJB69901.1 helix-turn-helix transcriptional regulator [Acaryochloris sp. 'Moss Beach']
MTHEELKAKALEQLEVAEEYNKLEEEFSLLRQMLAARQQAGMTQADIAQKMGTKATAVTRLESSLSSGKHSPSLSTLRKYAKAVGCRLEVTLIPEQ